jgi:hypothetical protein
MAFARAVLMYCGHSPREVEQMPLRDVRLFLDALPLIFELQNPFAGGFDNT